MANQHLDGKMTLIVSTDLHLVHHAPLAHHRRRGLPRQWRGSIRRVGQVRRRKRVSRVDRSLHVDVDVSRQDVLAHMRETVSVDQSHSSGEGLLTGEQWLGDDAIHGTIRISLERDTELLQDNAPAEGAVQGVLVHNDGIFDIVATEAHDSYCRVLAGAEFIESDQLNGPRCQQRSLRVAEEVEERVHATQLIVGDIAHGLLAHGTLVGVARGLIVVREGNQTGNHTHDCEGLDL
mmetsp:Transcript_18127/g.33119  ORF Transcript_18127/g.33119 Transcript_18127/m.33119 type:complete len:235 (+) Transcript_18127:819-1523(+)